MVSKVLMPRVDANVQEATIGRWHVQPGDRVRTGEPLVEVITDKASFELEADRDGILRAQAASEKSVVPVGYVIALVSDEPDEALPDVEAENRALLAAYRRALVAGDEPPGVARQAPARPAPGDVQATPAARRLAARAGVSLEELAARAGGVVQRRHVEEEILRRKKGARP
jgi:pyruvate/2-oxoglutarate dehydrogenase complex dihydrolipoamide acyltransferase (E2) component